MNETIDTPEVVPYKGDVVYDHIGEQFHGKIISILQAHKIQPDLVDWLNCFRPRTSGKKSDHLLIVKHNNNDNECDLSVYIFTATHSYSIVSKVPTERRPNGYVTAYAHCRIERAGEYWTRGSDLIEADYSFEGFMKVMLDILSYELVNQEAVDLGSIRMAFNDKELQA